MLLLPIRIKHPQNRQPRIKKVFTKTTGIIIRAGSRKYLYPVKDTLSRPPPTRESGGNGIPPGPPLKFFQI